MHFVVTWWSVTYFWIVFSWSIASLSTFTFIQVEWVKRETILSKNSTLLLLSGGINLSSHLLQGESTIKHVRDIEFSKTLAHTNSLSLLNGSSSHNLSSEESDSSRIFEVQFGLLGFCTRVGLSELKNCSTYSNKMHGISSIWQVLTYLGYISCLSLCLLSISSFLAVSLPTATLRLRAARKIGMAQLVAVILLFLSLVGFPGGFGSEFVKNYCGPTSRSFNIGDCEFGWSYVLLVVCAFLALYCPALVNFTFYIDRNHRQHQRNYTYFDGTRKETFL